MNRFAILLAAALCAAGTAFASGMHPAPVRAQSVTEQEMEQFRRVTGSLRAIQRSQVSAREEDRILEVKVREGVSVKKGDVLAAMDLRRLDARIQEEHANLEVARATVVERAAQVERDRREYQRLKRIDNPDAVSQQEIDLAESVLNITLATLESAKQNVKVVESRIAQLQIRREDMEIHAPFDGVVIARHTEAGEWIKAGAPVVTMISSGPVEAWLDVPEHLANRIVDKKLGLEVTLTATGEVFKAADWRVMPSVDPRVRTTVVIAVLNPPEGRELAPGASVIAYVPTGEAGPRKVVPKDALMKDATGFTVYKIIKNLDGSEAVIPVTVQVEFERGAVASVACDQLAIGDRVVIEGNERLRPMMPVQVLAGAPAAPAATEQASDDNTKKEAAAKP
ncbi:MAG: efflux RND transporter periplasmic adaptor subunit [Planctomycetes bacterium]|nr:efflux RND transporter periplasmic adaptor subunit [Planctomycetota bacterium]